MKIIEILNKIQKDLKSPKNQKNEFGKYNYRSCEDILESVKPLLGDTVLIMSDDVVQIGDRYYIKSTVSLKNSEDVVSTYAFARENEEQRGMNAAQITGATSSYARKYALNALFAIDDTKDADSYDNTSDKKDDMEDFKTKVNNITDKESLKSFYQNNAGKGKEYADIIVARSKELKND